MATKSRTVGDIMANLGPDALKQAIVANKWAKEKYPLTSEAAQLYPPVGITSAALEGIDAAQQGNPEEFGKAVLSAAPVSRTYKIGNKVAKGISDVLDTLPPGAAKKALELWKKLGAGENAAESFEAGQKHGEQYKRGGKVSKSSSSKFRGDGIAQRGKTKGRFV